MITEGQILNMCDELERRVNVVDNSFSVRVQSQKVGIHGLLYIVHIENASAHAEYEVNAHTHQWIRRMGPSD